MDGSASKGASSISFSFAMNCQSSLPPYSFSQSNSAGDIFRIHKPDFLVNHACEDRFNGFSFGLKKPAHIQLPLLFHPKEMNALVSVPYINGMQEVRNLRNTTISSPTATEQEAISCCSINYWLNSM